MELGFKELERQSKNVDARLRQTQSKHRSFLDDALHVHSVYASNHTLNFTILNYLL